MWLGKRWLFHAEICSSPLLKTLNTETRICCTKFGLAAFILQISLVYFIYLFCLNFQLINENCFRSRAVSDTNTINHHNTCKVHQCIVWFCILNANFRRKYYVSVLAHYSQNSVKPLFSLLHIHRDNVGYLHMKCTVAIGN